MLAALLVIHYNVIRIWLAHVFWAELFLSELVCKPFLQVEGILSSEIVLAIKCSTTKIDWSFQLLCF
jgi:hypothetical protein